MKKKYIKNKMKTVFLFDVDKELNIHSFLYKKLSRKQLKSIDEKVRFKTYKDWKNYIIARYEVYNNDNLIEFDKCMNVLLKEGKTFNSYAQGVAITYLSVIMTRLVDYYVDNIYAVMTCILIFPIIIVTVINLYDVYSNGREYVLLLKDVKDIIEELIEVGEDNKS